MKFEKKEDVIKYINNLQGFNGMVRFSHRKFDEDKDLFYQKTPKVENEIGFISEAYFCDDKSSISIKMLDGIWYIDNVNIQNLDENDISKYVLNIEKFGKKAKLAQIWEAKNDELCNNLKTLKLQKVVFAGFTGANDDK